jgi:hypothetical protein
MVDIYTDIDSLRMLTGLVRTGTVRISGGLEIRFCFTRGNNPWMGSYRIQVTHDSEEIELVRVTYRYCGDKMPSSNSNVFFVFVQNCFDIVVDLRKRAPNTYLNIEMELIKGGVNHTNWISLCASQMMLILDSFIYHLEKTRHRAYKKIDSRYITVSTWRLYIFTDSHKLQ